MLGRFGHRRSPLTSGYRASDRRVWIDQPTGGSWGAWSPGQVTSKVYSGAEQTIGVMANSILEDANHFETRELAEMVCQDVDSKDYTSELLALYNCLLANTRYMRDPRRVELVRAPWVISRMILDGHRPSIDCDDASNWMCAAGMAVGNPMELVTVAFADGMIYDGRQQYSHVFSRAPQRSGRAIVLDPVAAEKTPDMLRRVRAMRVWPISA